MLPLAQLRRCIRTQQTASELRHLADAFSPIWLVVPIFTAANQLSCRCMDDDAMLSEASAMPPRCPRRRSQIRSFTAGRQTPSPHATNRFDTSS